MKNETQHITVPNWIEANRAVDRVVGSERYTLGAGYDYPSPFAVFTKDAWSGDGMGYRVWTTKSHQLFRLVADISIGRVIPPDRSP